MPVIAIWNFSDSAPIACIGADNQKAGAMAAQHLLDLGHREIGTVFPPTQGNDRAGDRLKGAMRTLEQNDISVPDTWQSEAPYSLQQAKAAACEMLEHGHRPTALLCGNDVIAQGAIYAALKLGLVVPDDLSVIGIGDFKGSEEMGARSDHDPHSGANHRTACRRRDHPRHCRSENAADASPM